MSVITLVHAVVSRLPVRREQTHGGAQASDALLSITEPRDGYTLQQRLFLQATSSGEPPVQSMTDGEALVLYDGGEESWLRAEPDSFVEWGAER